jgi:hypothetical protein
MVRAIEWPLSTSARLLGEVDIRVLGAQMSGEGAFPRPPRKRKEPLAATLSPQAGRGRSTAALLCHNPARIGRTGFHRCRRRGNVVGVLRPSGLLRKPSEMGTECAAARLDEANQS